MPPTTTIVFEDRNFKLAVIQELMYRSGLLTPVFDLRTFLEQHPQTLGQEHLDAYEPIPEVLQYFDNLEIDTALADKVTEIYQDGGDEIYHQIAPLWDGEDDIFTISSAADARHFPNLKNMVLLFGEPGLLTDLRNAGIEAEWL